MNARSIYIIAAFVAFATAQTQYLTITSYNDSQCAFQTGGYLVIALDGNCATSNAFPSCTANAGLYVKGTCGTTDPMSPLPAGVAIQLGWPRTTDCTEINKPYFTAIAGIPETCFSGDSLIYKFSVCSSGTMTLLGYTDKSTCESGGTEFYGDNGADSVCRATGASASNKLYCPMNPAPMAPTSAQSTNAPKSGTTPTQAPIKSSYGVINASISSIMLLGALILVLA